MLHDITLFLAKQKLPLRDYKNISEFSLNTETFLRSVRHSGLGVGSAICNANISGLNPRIRESVEFLAGIKCRVV